MQRFDEKRLTREQIVLLMTILGSSMAFIDGTAVNVSLPALQGALHASVANLQWFVESYALTLAGLLLVGGSLGDTFGRRKIYTLGVTIFAAASACCGLAGGVNMLIVARLIQGAGAALLIPGGLALISETFSTETRGQAIGIWSGASAIATAVGPVAAGWLIEHASWRWVFFLNLPIAILVLGLSLKVPRSPIRDGTVTFDWSGALLGTSGLACITYAMIEWPSRNFARVPLVVIAGVGITALAFFVITEQSSAHPMLPVHLFRSRNFAGANLLTFLLYGSLSGLMFFYPMDLIQVQHYKSVEAGAAFLPFVIIMATLSRWSGGLVARFGARAPLTIGPVISACGFALFASAPQASVYWRTFFPGAVVLGVGMTICVAPLTTTAMNAVRTSESGVASGINNAVSRVAALLGIASFGALLIGVFNRSLDKRLSSLGLSPADRANVDVARPLLAGSHALGSKAQEAVTLSFLTGYRAVLWTAACLTAIGALGSWLLIVNGIHEVED